MIGTNGRIITFYSYKGGTGRSMALANVAWILASNEYRVLTIDWDLEAPGLHRYFRPFLIDPELADSPGLIDFIWSYAADALTPTDTEQESTVRWEKVTDLDFYTVQLDWDFPGRGCVDLICAGRQDINYAEKVNSFDWTNLYRRLDGEALFAELGSRLKKEYDFILIDSRTGVSDTSGICTVSMPDSVVAFYTLNRQSVGGVAAVLESIRGQRGHDFPVFPIVTRVELAEKERLEAARRRMRVLFQKFINHGSDEVSSKDYWADAEILYQPYYAYEEMLAVFGDPTGADRSANTLLAAMEKLTAKITRIRGIQMPSVPEVKRREILGQFDGAKNGGDPKSDRIEDSEERRNRVARYLEKDLGSPGIWLQLRARFERKYSRLTTCLVFFSIIVFISMVVYSQIFRTEDSPFNFTGNAISTWNAISLLFAMFTAVSKVLELMRPTRTGDEVVSPQLTERVSQKFAEKLGERVSMAFVTLLMFFISFGSFVFSTISASQHMHVTLVEGAALGALLLGFMGQCAALIGRFDEKAQRFQGASEALKAEIRAYVHEVGPYSEKSESREAWKLFLEEIEGIVSVDLQQVNARRPKLR